MLGSQIKTYLRIENITKSSINLIWSKKLHHKTKIIKHFKLNFENDYTYINISKRKYETLKYVASWHSENLKVSKIYYTTT
jgi:hypothetical protein